MPNGCQHRTFAIMLLALAVAWLPGCAAPQRFSFIATADMRGYAPPEHPGPDYFAGVCQAIREVGPGEFMITPGDEDPPERVRATIDAVLGKSYVWYPVVGNHEGDKPEHMAYLRAYNPGGNTLPNIVRAGPPGAVETCYSFDYGPAHFAVINQYYDGQGDMAVDGDVTDPLYDWLARDLTENKQPLVFVLGHEPAVAIPDLDNGRVRHRGDSLDKYPENNHRFWSLLREHDVLAYFCGHTHNTSIARINGVWQIDCGHARGLGDKGARSSFLKLAVDGPRVRCDVYRRDTADGQYRLTYSEELR